jgi:predicted MPP superfamily phosphohydrolase
VGRATGARRTAGVRRTAGIALGLGIAAAGAAHVWCRYVEVNRFVLREQELRILPPGTRPVRLLHISDLHLMPDQQLKIDFLRHLSTTKPHLVIDTGDNIASALSVPVLADALAPLLRRPGAFVMGSNDMFAPGRRNPLRYFRRDARPEGLVEQNEPNLPLDELRGVLSGHGWKDLTNTRATIQLAGLTVQLAGVDDPHLERDRFPARDPEPSRDRADQARGVLRLGVAHAPYRRVLDAFVDDGAHLILAGHTHGGQMRLPGVGALVTNCDLPRSQAKGLSTWHGVPLNVSGGLGANPYTNYRFANRPEASLLTLRPVRPS